VASSPSPSPSRATRGGQVSPLDGRELRTQGRQTMAKLLDAGMQVLTERGYHAARVDDVVRHARVSHGTFYLYFSSKEDLIKALAGECAEEMKRLAASLGPVGPGDEGLVELRRWVREFIECYQTFGVVIRAWMEDQVTSRELSRLGVRTFGAVTSSLVARIEEARPGQARQSELEAAALLALLERFTYFFTSRNLGFADDDTVETLARLTHRAFFQPAAA
jgi:AcrR family transcriptional regulator